VVLADCGRDRERARVKATSSCLRVSISSCYGSTQSSTRGPASTQVPPVVV
jgi:hypothetical protein